MMTLLGVLHAQSIIARCRRTPNQAIMALVDGPGDIQRPGYGRRVAKLRRYLPDGLSEG